MGDAIDFITLTFVVVLSSTVGLFAADTVSTAWRQISTFSSCNAQGCYFVSFLSPLHIASFYQILCAIDYLRAVT